MLHKPERLTALATFAIFIATAVAVGVGIAQWRALHSTDEAIHGQLEEMKQQRLLTITLQRANLRREQPQVRPIGEGGKLIGAGEKLTGWAISPACTNAGGTSAKEYRGWFDIEAFAVRSGQTHLGPADCLPIPEPNPLPGAGTFQAGNSFLQLAKTLSLDDATQAKAETKYIFSRPLTSRSER